MNENNLNKNISELRKAAGLTQEALASKLGLSYQAVSKWENGLSCPDVLLLPKLAEIFGVSIDALFGLEKPETAIAPVTEPESVLPWPDDEGIYMVVYQGHTLITEDPAELNPRLKELPFVWKGPALNVSSVLSLRVSGNVRGDASAGGSISCDGVGGNAMAGDNINCDGVSGDITAGGNVTCDQVYGSIEAGGSVTCDAVGGNITAGGNVTCDAVGGSVSTGGRVIFDDDDNWHGIKGSFRLDRENMTEEQREKYENIKRNAENIADSALGAADKALNAVEKALKGIFK